MVVPQRSTTVAPSRIVPTIAHFAQLRRLRCGTRWFEFTGTEAREVGRGFGRAVRESGYQILACSILPAHVHLVVARHSNSAEKIAGHLKARATQALVDTGLHPFAALRGPDGRFPSVWARRSWKVFLDDEEALTRAVRYVQRNPLKERKPAQTWSFVEPGC